ncbi:MAG: acetate--CoA ligase family protein, partial [Candidatus Bathyarchaeia archaeon]
VKALIVISAGFKETGVEGAALEKHLLEVCRKYGMRMQGPNCLGVINTSIPLNLSFAASMPKRGNIGFISQSGALGTAVLDWVIKEDIGFASFVSLGNKADLDEIDFVEAMADDPEVRVILLYVESIEEGERFVQVARGVTRKKPLIVLKGGTSSAGARAAGSHTGAMVGSFTAYQTAFRQSGVIMTNSVEELFGYAIAFSTQPLPLGDTVAIVTNAGGPGILATDMCENLGVRLAHFSEETLRRLGEKLPPSSSVSNPVDILGDAMADRYRMAMEEVFGDPSVNSLLLILTPQAMTESLETAKIIVELSQRGYKPILAVFMGGESVEEASKYLIDEGVPCFDFPEKAVRALSALIQYSKFLERPESRPEVLYDVDKAAVREIIESVRSDKRVVLLPHEAAEVARAYGIHVPLVKVATRAEEAVRSAEEIGYPVVLKVVSPEILHKTDVGGIVLDLKSPEGVRGAYGSILSRVSRYMPRAHIYGVLVTKMVPQGKELIIGVSRDIQFGPLVMFGLGGIYVDFLRDISFRLAPLSLEDAREMVGETKAYTLLKGVRGESPSDINALLNTLLRVSQLAADFPEIVEMDINPLFAYEEGKGCIAIDVKITLSRS